MGEKLIAMIASVLIGGGFLVFGCIKAIKVGASRKWPQVTGTVIQSAVECNTDADTDPYVVSIQYEYVVNSVRCSAAQEMGRYLRQSSAQACVEWYAVNSSVVVYYDPENPANAVLEPNYTKVIFAVVGGVVLLLIGGRLAFELALR